MGSTSRMGSHLIWLHQWSSWLSSSPSSSQPGSSSCASYIHVYVYIYIYIHTHIHLHIHMHIHIHIHLRIRIRIRIHTHTHTHTHIYIYIYAACLSIYLSTCLPICQLMHVCIYASMFVSLYVCMYVCMYACMYDTHVYCIYVYIYTYTESVAAYTYIHTYIHTYMHAYIHTYIQTFLAPAWHHPKILHIYIYISHLNLNPESCPRPLVSLHVLLGAPKLPGQKGRNPIPDPRRNMGSRLPAMKCAETLGLICALCLQGVKALQACCTCQFARLKVLVGFQMSATIPCLTPRY